ncbi:hypothetical protein N9790_06085, partial [Gammaproteobacteria bacterium]|nr:hypothetical protein [Gammaproteobacteria bacterium]
NTSLTGVTISNVEIVNITGADNIASTSTAAATAVAGAKQVQVLDVGSLSLESEVQTIDMGDLTINAAGTTGISIGIAGGTVVTAVQAAAASATAMATTIVTAINADTVVGGAAATPLVTATSVGTVVTLAYTAAYGEAPAATLSAGTGMTFVSTQQVTSLPSSVEAKTSSAEIQNLNLDTWVKKGAGTAEVDVLGTTVTTASIADNAADTVVATAVALAITTAGTATGNALLGLVSAVASGDNVIITYAASVGDGAAASMQFNLAAAAITAVFDDGIITDKAADKAADETRKGGEIDLTISINGSDYTVQTVVDGDVLSATDATAATAQVTSSNTARTAIKTQLDTLLGDAVTVGDSDQSGEIKLTSKVTGAALPTVTVTGRDSTTNLLTVDSADATTVANAEKTSTTVAVAQQAKYTVGGTIAATDSFAIYIDGVSYGSVNPTTTTGLSATTPLAAGLNAILGDGVAVAVGSSVVITAPTAGVPLPLINIVPTDAGGSDLTFVRSENRENIDLAVATVSSTDAAISAASFGGAEQIWLKGDSNTTNVSGVSTQTIGLSGIASMDNEVNYASTATSGNIVISGAKGALSVKGAKLATLNVSGTGSTGTTITDGSTTDTIETLNVDASGTMTLTASAMTALTTVASSGTGGLVLTSGGLESITTGAGADSVTASLATVIDNANTTADETKNAVVSTGAGNDKVVVNTSGTGITTVETGEGNDTVKVVAMGSGDNLVELGAGSDTAWLDGGLAEVSSTNVVDGGDGTDTLDITGRATYTAGDYTRYKVGALNFEKVIFTGQAGNTTAVDASKFAGIQSFQFNGGSANQIIEVSGSIMLGSQAPTGAYIGGTDYLGSRPNAAATGITASSLGYELDSDTTTAGNQTVYGGNLAVTVAGFGLGASAAVVANAASTTITAASVAGSTALSVANSAPVVTLTGDTKAATFILSSTRVVSTTAGTEVMAGATVTLDPASGSNLTLDALTSLTVYGAGVVTFDLRDTAGDSEDLTGNLTTINLSGMTAFADLDEDGLSENGSFGYNNTSTAAVTLNDAVIESVVLGGAVDTVTTGSTVEFTDSIQGFQLVATADTADAVDVVDTDVSDVLDITGASHTIVADDTAYSSLDAALLALSATSGKKAAFHADGNTYIFINSADAILDNSDQLVELVGTYDLDLLVNVAS